MDDDESVSPTATDNQREAFRVSDELLSTERLAPNVQLLLATRSRAIEELADQGFATVLAIAKLFAASGRPALPRVGVIGGGAVGCAVLMKLLVHAYPPDHLALSTRQPERVPVVEALKSPAAVDMFEQVPRYEDNTRLARESDVVVLCVPPLQLKGVARQIQFASAERSHGGNSSSLMVISALCGVSRENLVKSCGTSAVLRIQWIPPASPSSAETKSASKLLEAIVVALARLGDGEGTDATTEPPESDDQSARAAHVRDILLAHSLPTNSDATPTTAWPADWQHQLERRVVDIDDDDVST